MSQDEEAPDKPQDAVVQQHGNGGDPVPGQGRAHAPGEQEAAAQMIQRNYRGYRERRQLEGMGLDASTRWSEVRIALLIYNVVQNY